MHESAVDWNDRDGSAVLRPREAMDRPRVASLWAAADRVVKQKSPSRLILDLRAAERIDGAGVALVRKLEDLCRESGIPFSIEGATPAVSGFLEFVQRRTSQADSEPPSEKSQASFRDKVDAWRHSATALVEFVGRFAQSAASLVAHPRKLRLGEVLYQVQKAGADGMWLLIFLSLLLGVIMAFQGLTGVRGFGSPILVADVVTISTIREMAPLLTGVIVTGRSGAAIAAEIGSMKIHEEIDALSVMGFDVMKFLLIPRTLGLVIATPLLTLLSIGAGIVGGAAVALFVLHLSAVSYFAEVEKAVHGARIVSALVKGITFGLTTGVIAGFQGMQAGKAAEDVGKQTTAAVVSSILLIILGDAFFSVVSEVYGW